jgi:hypothetical protein
MGDLRTCKYAMLFAGVEKEMPDYGRIMTIGHVFHRGPTVPDTAATWLPQCMCQRCVNMTYTLMVLHKFKARRPAKLLAASCQTDFCLVELHV